MKRFPDARPVATAAVVADIKSSVAEQEKQWQRRLGDDVDKTAVVPEPLEVIHIPSIDTVSAATSSTTELAADTEQADDEHVGSAHHRGDPAISVTGATVVDTP